MIELRVLGEIRLLADDGADVDALLRQPKRLALLSYLASPAPGTWHRRDMLLALFWPELDTAHARTSLRNALYVIRQTLGDSVLRNRGDEEISIDPDVLRTDLSIVWAALRDGRIDEALANYTGELLPGLFPSDSEGFQRWLDSERARLKVSVSTAAMAKVDQLERAGDVAGALAIARKVTEINADDETVVRRVMKLHEALGDKAGGLALFESYRARLAKDFEAEPAPETIEIANRLRSLTAPLTKRTPIESSALAVPPSQADLDKDQIHHVAASRHRLPIAGIAVLVVLVVAVAAWNLSRGPKPASISRSTPLTSDEGLQVEAALSPNGRLVAYAKGSPNRLQIFVQRIDGGEPWPLSGDTVNVELMPRWSPDNDEILFLSRNNAYASPTMGGRARIIAKGADGDAMIRSAAWSPAGDSVAIVRYDSLLVQSSHGGATRLVGRGFQLHSCTWSPNGKWIACVSGNWIAYTPGPLFGNDAPSSILLYPAAGGNPIALTSNENESESPAWSADGKFLWILSNKDGTTGEAFAIPIGSDGHVSGDFVRLGVNAESISLSPNRVAYSVPSKKANLWSIPIPRDTPVSVSAATQITSGNQVIEIESVSRDGKWIVYDSNLRGNADIYRLPIDGGASESLTDDSRPEYAAELSPDGNEVAWQRWVNGVRHLFVKRVDGDPEEEIWPVPGDQGVPRWSLDGRKLAAWSHNNERGGVFVIARDARGKWMPPSWRLDYGQLPVWSPDNSEIAFVTLDGKVQSIPADSGSVATVYSPRPGSDDPLATFLVWRDPDVIWVLGRTQTRQGIWALSRSKGTTRLLVSLHDPVGNSIGPAFTSDGKRFYFALNQRFSNVRWAELTTP
jgi:Tol biopolymer transport system component/DNA-binding SARP family transcriptional activator